MTKFATAALVLAWVNMGTPAAVHAEERTAQYPQRIVKIIVPFPAGGTADILPRIVAEKLRERLGQPFIIENRSGAGGNIGAETVAKSDPDGYTLLASPPGPIAINEALYPNLAYRPSDLKPIIVLGTVPNVLAVRSTLSAKTVGELIALAKSNPGGVTFASQGNGSTSHLSAILFQVLTGTKMLHVPYRGTAPALQDLIAGNVDLFFDNLGSSLSLHQSGQSRILAVGSVKRVKSLPDVPSVEEAGVPGFQSMTWFAMMASPNTPDPIVARLNEVIAEILREPDLIAQFEKIGVQPSGTNLEATNKFIADERARWRDVVKSANITLE
jgi:tripartite-type tricarboxylate transporter receptor subunit TctC